MAIMVSNDVHKLGRTIGQKSSFHDATESADSAASKDVEAYKKVLHEDENKARNKKDNKLTKKDKKRRNGSKGCIEQLKKNLDKMKQNQEKHLIENIKKAKDCKG